MSHKRRVSCNRVTSDGITLHSAAGGPAGTTTGRQWHRARRFGQGAFKGRKTPRFWENLVTAMWWLGSSDKKNLALSYADRDKADAEGLPPCHRSTQHQLNDPLLTPPSNTTCMVSRRPKQGSSTARGSLGPRAVRRIDAAGQA